MKLRILISATLIFFQHPIVAEFVTDGTVGDTSNIGLVQPITAIDEQLIIGQELGSLKGGNLFHSFQQFDIETSETAIFTGEAAIQNVISRVTGGIEPTIDGTLESKIDGADFYFINPAGVVFGKNAHVNVPASFHISTADELIFDDADSSSFNASNPEASTLTAASPEAFGFTSGQNGSLEINGSELIFKPGTDVSLSANSIKIDQQAAISKENFDSIQEPGIRLNLSAVDTTTRRTIPITGHATTTTGGEILIEDSTIRVSGNGSGRLAIRAGTMSAYDSKLIADNIGNNNMHEDDGINVHVDSLVLKKTTLRNTTDKDGEAGTIFFAADKTLKLMDEGSQIASTAATGNTGKIKIRVDESLKVLKGGKIRTGIFSSVPISSITTENSGGKPGNLTIHAGQLIVDGDKSSIESKVDSGFSDTGDVSISDSELIKVSNGGVISAANFGMG